MPETVYADDYEVITGQKRPVETKVIAAPDQPAAIANLEAETKALDAAAAAVADAAAAVAPVTDPAAAPVIQPGA